MAATHKQVRRKPDLPTYVATLGTSNEMFVFASYLDWYFICTDIFIFKYLQTLYDWYTNYSASQ